MSVPSLHPHQNALMEHIRSNGLPDRISTRARPASRFLYALLRVRPFADDTCSEQTANTPKDAPFHQ